MTITAEALRELHRIHRQLTDLRDRLERGPKQLQATVVSVQKMTADVEQAKESHKRSRVLVDDRQLQLKGRESRIADLETKLNLASSNREYQALKEQIAADRQANSVLEDEILEGLEKIDETVEKVKVAEGNLEKAKLEASKVRERVEGARDKLESELVRVQGELDQAEAKLPEDFRINYQRIAKVRGEDTLAQVEGEVCGGCFQRITSQMMNELYMSKPVFCKSCGCLLYVSEDRSPRSS